MAEAAPGRRLAVNLSGVAHHQVVRGDVLVRSAQWEPTQMLDASLTVLAALDHDVTRRGAYALYLGSGEHPVRLRVLGPDALAPGATGSIRIHLPVPLPLLPGDRFVLRENGRGETIGGGEVLDVAPVERASRARPDRRVERVVAEWGWVDAARLERLTGTAVAPTVGSWVVDPAVLAVAVAALHGAIETAGPSGLDLAGLDDRDRALVATLEGVAVEGGRVRWRDAPADRSDHPYVVALEAAPFAPPTPEEAGVPRSELRDLLRLGLVVERDGFHFAASAVEEAVRRVAGVLATSPGGATAVAAPRRVGHEPEVRPPPAQPPRRRGDHPPAGRRPDRRAPACRRSADRQAERSSLGLAAASDGRERGRRDRFGVPVAASASRATEATSTTLVMTSPKASGSASSHEWLPVDHLAVVPDRLAQGVEGGPRDDPVLVAPQHDDRQVPGASAPRARGRGRRCGPAWPTRHRARGLRRRFGRASSRITGSTFVSCGSGQDVAREVEAPVPQRPLGHRCARLGPPDARPSRRRS